MKINPPPGFTLDMPPGGTDVRWRGGYNVRFRLNQPESIAPWGLMRDAADNPIQHGGATPVRTLMAHALPDGFQILGASVNHIDLIQPDTGTPVPDNDTTRYLAPVDLTPAGLPVLSDDVPHPAGGRVFIPPHWVFEPTDDYVIMLRAGAVEDVYVWDRVPGNLPVAIPGAPQGAVGAALSNRILVLLGADPLVPTLPNGTSRLLTVRWSDRADWGEWTPAPDNTAGEVQLEDGSRIVGGGSSSLGVPVWTDTGLYLLRERFDTLFIFDIDRIDGAKGLMSNKSWVEADGRLWWLASDRSLNVYDGTRARTITNPIKLTTIERMGVDDVPRVHAWANPETNEVSFWFADGPTPSTESTRALVYNYDNGAFSMYVIPRTALSPRRGTQLPVGVSDEGTYYLHEIDFGLPDHLSPTGINGLLPDEPDGPNLDAFRPVRESVEPLDWAIATNMFELGDDSERQTFDATRIIVDNLHAPAQGAELFFNMTVRVRGHEWARMSADFTEDLLNFNLDTGEGDIRVGGRALSIGIFATGEKALTRLGTIGIAVQPAGER